MCPQDEELMAQLETILDETVKEALSEQYAELNAGFRRQTEKLSKRLVFWRKTAVTEGLVILGAVLIGGTFLRMQK